jgi:hypothetical protein
MSTMAIGQTHEYHGDGQTHEHPDYCFIHIHS